MNNSKQIKKHRKIALIVILIISIVISCTLYFFPHAADKTETQASFQTNVPEKSTFKGNFTVSQGYIKTGFRLFARGWINSKDNYT